MQRRVKLLSIIKWLLLFTAFLFLFSLWHRSPDIDDAWIGEHAYWMAKVGYVKSELMHGVNGQEVRNVVHHKFFTLNGWAFIKLFGFSLFTLKSVSLFWLAVFLVVFFRYTSRKLGEPSAWLALLLITANAFIFQYSFVYRPEIMVMALGFVSFIFLEKFLENQKPDWRWLIISGLAAGLAAAAHLNGLIFIAAGGLLLLWQKKPGWAFLFGLASIPTFSVYFFDFTREYNFSYWLYQISDSPALHNSSVLPDSLAFPAKLLREHLRFFHSPKEISLSLMVLFALITGFRLLKSESRVLLRYLLLLVVTLSLLTVHTTSKYLMLYLPLLILLSTRIFVYIYEHRSEEILMTKRLSTRKLWPWALGLSLLYLSINTGWNIYTSLDKSDPLANRQLSLKYFGPDTYDLRIVAPMNFIFNEIEHFERIQGDLSFADMQKAGKDISGKKFLYLMDSLKVDYLILSDEYYEKFGLSQLPENVSDSAGFRIIGQEHGLQVIINQYNN